MITRLILTAFQKPKTLEAATVSDQLTPSLRSVVRPSTQTDL